MMGRSPKCYILSFIAIGLPVLENNDFWKAFTIYWRGRILGQVIYTLCINFQSPAPVSSHMVYTFKLPNRFFGEKNDKSLKTQCPLAKVKELS